MTYANFRIAVLIPSSGAEYHATEYTLKAQSLQDAVDMAFGREIYNGEKTLIMKHALNEELAISREDIGVIAYTSFDDNGKVIESFVQDGSTPRIYAKPPFEHPSRLSDNRIKELILNDFSINKFDVNVGKLMRMNFLI